MLDRGELTERLEAFAGGERARSEFVAPGEMYGTERAEHFVLGDYLLERLLGAAEREEE